MPTFYSCKQLGSKRCRNLLRGIQLERSRTLESDFKASFLRHLGKLDEEIRGQAWCLDSLTQLVFLLQEKPEASEPKEEEKAPAGSGGVI